MVDGGRGQIALLDASDGHAVIDRADVEGAGAPQSVLVARVIATHRELAAAGHRLVATRLCSALREKQSLSEFGKSLEVKGE